MEKKKSVRRRCTKKVLGEIGFNFVAPISSNSLSVFFLFSLSLPLHFPPAARYYETKRAVVHAFRRRRFDFLAASPFFKGAPPSRPQIPLYPSVSFSSCAVCSSISPLLLLLVGRQKRETPELSIELRNYRQRPVISFF